jgi:hypothetical protein
MSNLGKTIVEFDGRAVTAALTIDITDVIRRLKILFNPAHGRVTLFAMTSSGGLRARAEKLTQAIGGPSYIENRTISVPNRGSSFLTNHGRLP